MQCLLVYGLLTDEGWEHYYTFVGMCHTKRSRNRTRTSCGKYRRSFQTVCSAVYCLTTVISENKRDARISCVDTNLLRNFRLWSFRQWRRKSKNWISHKQHRHHRHILRRYRIDTRSVAVVKVVVWSRGGSPDEARLEQTPYPFQPH